MELEAYGHDKISIHALREEGDVSWATSPSLRSAFLSTPSARRATIVLFNLDFSGSEPDFYPRPPRGGRRGLRNTFISRSVFLSTPSARRATCSQDSSMCWYFEFLSTPSARRATRQLCDRLCNQSDFYPRPPRGGRQQKQRQNLYFLINYTTFCTNLEEP